MRRAQLRIERLLVGSRTLRVAKSGREVVKGPLRIRQQRVPAGESIHVSANRLPSADCPWAVPGGVTIARDWGERAWVMSYDCLTIGVFTRRAAAVLEARRIVEAMLGGDVEAPFAAREVFERRRAAAANVRR